MGSNFRKGREQGAGAVPELQRVGWAVKRFCDEADISLAMFYKLGPHQRPASVKVGSKRVVIESPAAWLSRSGSGCRGAAMIAATVLSRLEQVRQRGADP